MVGEEPLRLLLRLLFGLAFVNSLQYHRALELSGIQQPSVESSRRSATRCPGIYGALCSEVNSVVSSKCWGTPSIHPLFGRAPSATSTALRCFPGCVEALSEPRPRYAEVSRLEFRR